MADSAHILVIEATTAKQQWLSDLLSNAGYWVDCVADSAAAVTALESLPAVVVLGGTRLELGHRDRGADLQAQLHTMGIPLLWLQTPDLDRRAVKRAARDCLLDYLTAP
ncbi:MAG: hypothetical protein O2890_02920, partial [Cyanobacteria bacterium]|nr:hypothetical protein [Cyanobacteriota bacterium]